MIEAFGRRLSTAWSCAARLLGANRRRHFTFATRGVGAAIVVPILAAPARVVARAPAETLQTFGYRETERMRCYYATTRR